jgi:hypothetical protein
LRRCIRSLDFEREKGLMFRGVGQT